MDGERRRWWVACLAAGLSACASLPPPVAALAWRDDWGDRGPQVLARDHQWCAQAVESRRSQLADCMARRGWRVGP